MLYSLTIWILGRFLLPHKQKDQAYFRYAPRMCFPNTSEG